jgi:CHAT domain
MNEFIEAAANLATTPTPYPPPEISGRVVCIVNRQSVGLAAIVSSYLHIPGCYPPIFLFPKVDASKSRVSTKMSIEYVAELLGGDLAVLIRNAIARIGVCEYVVLAGLSEHQKSFLELPAEMKVVEVKDESDVANKLSELPLPRRQEMKIKPSAVLEGLHSALSHERRLVLSDDAQSPPDVRSPSRGLVVIECVDDASAVVAINYAHSVGASVALVEPLKPRQRETIIGQIKAWKEASDFAAFEEIASAVSVRTEGLETVDLDYVTFFTEGLPYSLFLRGKVACSYVHLSLRPDLFVLNNLLCPMGEAFNSAVVFSPVFFHDEETDWLCDHFKKNNQYLRVLVGDNATVVSLEFTTQHFPYDVLHVCSHGGEVEGYEMTVRFEDQDGTSHTVDFDETVGLMPVPEDHSKVRVSRKIFPRHLDGVRWASDELHDKKLPHHVYQAMWNSMMDASGVRKPKGAIELSSSIKCSDSVFQGEVHMLAAMSSPIIFNNTCGSWSEVATTFLAYGARGYIGTLWSVENHVAVRAAKAFYQNLSGHTVLHALGAALAETESTASENIYVYWGLHFARLEFGVNRSAAVGRRRVLRELIDSVWRWVSVIESAGHPERARNAERVLHAVLREIRTNFDSAGARKFELEIKQRIPRLDWRSQSESPEDSDFRVVTRSERKVDVLGRRDEG